MIEDATCRVGETFGDLVHANSFDTITFTSSLQWEHSYMTGPKLGEGGFETKTFHHSHNSHCTILGSTSSPLLQINK